VSSKVQLHLDFEAHRSSEKFGETRALAFARRSRFRRFVPQPIRRRLRRLLASPLNTSKIELDDETREFLAAQLAADARRLSELTGENFARSWGIAA
jgi:hypothetical protein